MAVRRPVVVNGCPDEEAAAPEWFVAALVSMTVAEDGASAAPAFEATSENAAVAASVSKSDTSCTEHAKNSSFTTDDSLEVKCEADEPTPVMLND